MNISKYLIIFFITFFQISVYSQGSLGADSISTPQAPNAASLGLYGDIPVSFHTGVPNISVPIFNVQDGALELPISISYHSSGVKVESVASWVGLGWSLNAGGVISRTIHGIKDEGGISPEFQNTEGYYETFGTTALDTNNMFDVNGSSFWTRIANNEIDGQSDMYNFNFNGYSGVFYFDENRKARFRNHQDLKLHVEFDEQVDPINDMHSRFVYFVITTPDGTKYYFGGDENGANINAIDRVFSRSLNFNNSVIPEVTAWHLVKVVDHNDAIQITLDYESQTFTTQTLGTWRSSVDVYDVFHGSSGQGTFDDGSITNLNLTQEARLSKITSTNHEVNFIAKDAREDLGSSSYFTGTIFGGNLPANTDPQAKRLEQIVIKGRKGSCLKTIDFTTDYFQCNQISYLTPYNPLTSAAGAGNPDLKKLRLLSIEEKVCNGQSIDPISHTFKYVDQDFGDVGAQIPGRLSLSQDMWGYFNGALGNTTLLPDRPHKYIPAQDVGYTPSPSLINLGFEQNCSGVPTNCDCEDVNKSVISVDDVILTPNWNDHMQISIDLSQKDFCNGNPNNGAPYTVQLNIYKKNIDGTESSVASRIFGFDQQNPSADASFKIKVPVDPGFNYIERGNIYRVELAKYGNSADKPFKMDLSVDEYNSGLAKYDLYPQWNDNIKKYNHPTLPIQVNSFLANRIPDAQKMKFGILKQVTYPTGGRTTFDFEPHDYKNSYNEFTKTYVDGTFNCQPGNSCADCQNNNAAEVNGLQFTLADNSEYYSVEATATRPNPNDGFTGCPTTTSPLDGMFYIIDEQTGERREFAMLL
ncbi:MAG: hypothetical protein MRY83_16230, partial [Flavobacteriales bacterium]|nr:hypothetical protein [Flavobacteriales bacterium]